MLRNRNSHHPRAAEWISLVLLLFGQLSLAQEEGISTVEASVQKEGDKFFLVREVAPGQFDHNPASGHPDTLESARARSRQIADRWSELGAGGLFNPLSIKTRSHSDGTFEIVSFEGEFSTDPAGFAPEISSVQGSIHKSGDKYFLHISSAPGSFDASLITGNPLVLAAAASRTEDLLKKTQNISAGGLFNPLNMKIKPGSTGVLELVSFE